jgi:hypothetical protein
MSLNEALHQIKEASRSRMPPESVAIMSHATEQLIESGIINNALAAGDQAPDFALEDWQGNRYDSKEILPSKPLILTFYRGSW